MRRPLDDVRVLAIEQFGAGPWATLQLADLGAEVIKIEDPSSGGDVGRYVPPYRSGEDSLYFQTESRNKISICFDFDRDVERIRALVKWCDAVVEDLGPGGLDGVGLVPSALSAANPALCLLRLSPFEAKHRVRAARACGNGPVGTVAIRRFR